MGNETKLISRQSAPSNLYSSYMSGEPQTNYWMEQATATPSYVADGQSNRLVYEEVNPRLSDNTDYPKISRSLQRWVDSDNKNNYKLKLQKLKDIGFYDKKIDGVWGVSSRLAETEARRNGYKWDERTLSYVPGHSIAADVNTVQQEKSNDLLALSNNPGVHLIRKFIYGVTGKDASYDKASPEVMKVLLDLNLWIYDNYKAAMANNAAVTTDPEARARILELASHIELAGGLENYLKAYPNRKVVIGGNFAHYKKANLDRFPEGTPDKYANFNYKGDTSDYAGYAMGTPLGNVETIYGNTMHSFVYDPDTGLIKRAVSDAYNFNPKGSSKEGSNVDKLRELVGNDEYLGENSKGKVKYRYLLPSTGFKANLSIRPEEAELAFGIPRFGTDTENLAMDLALAKRYHDPDAQARLDDRKNNIIEGLKFWKKKGGKLIPRRK